MPDSIREGSEGAWSAFGQVRGIEPHTVNFVDSPNLGPVPLSMALCALVVLLTGVLFLAFRREKARGLLRAFLAASTVGALLFAARMDYGWARWVVGEARATRGLDSAGRVARLDGSDLVGLSQDLRNVVPRGKPVRILAGDDVLRNRLDRRYVPGRVRLEVSSPTVGKVVYHSLPVTPSEKADYVVVFRDPRVSYDEPRRALLENGAPIATGVVPLKRYAADIVLYGFAGAGP